MASKQRRSILHPADASWASTPRQYRFAELETGATLAALNDALEWRGIPASDIVAVRCRPPVPPYGRRRAQYRVIYSR